MKLPSSHYAGLPSRHTLLDALEYGIPPTMRQLSLQTRLDEKTVRRACRHLTSQGILIRPKSPSSRYLPLEIAGSHLIPLLELDQTTVTLRIGDPRLQSIFSLVKEKSDHISLEEIFTTLSEQAEALLYFHYPHRDKRPPMGPAVLLYTGDTSPSEHIRNQVQACLSSMGMSRPPLSVSVTEALPRELRYFPAVATSHLVLYIRTAGEISVACFTREHDHAPFVPIPCTSHWSTVLQTHLHRHILSPSAGLSAFLEEFLRILPVDTIVVEMDPLDTPLLPSDAPLPAHTTLHILPTDSNTPTMAQRGALRLARRILWDEMTECR